MKKRMLMLVTAGLISFGTFAQGPTPEKIAERKTTHMKEKLGLDEVQYKKMYAIHFEQAKKQQEEAKIRKERQAALKKQYEAVLSPEQLKKWEETKRPTGRRYHKK